jgi:RHS repeat-associated protein
VSGTLSNPNGGLYDFLFREYNPQHGRWISPDPAGVSAVSMSNPQTWNRYAYVGNRPLGNLDPTGLDAVTALGLSYSLYEIMQNAFFFTFYSSVADMIVSGDSSLGDDDSDGDSDGDSGGDSSGVSGLGGRDCNNPGCSSNLTARQDRGLTNEKPANNIKSRMLKILGSNSNCAAAYGGQQNAENLLNNMTIYQVPSPYSGPFQGSYNAVTANNNGATPGWQDSASTSMYTSPNGTWNGSQYGTFVGNNFNAAFLGQQETILFHEMAHPYWEPDAAGVDNLNGMYSPYGGQLGGIPAVCGTAPLPPTPPPAQ